MSAQGWIVAAFDFLLVLVACSVVVDDWQHRDRRPRGRHRR